MRTIITVLACLALLSAAVSAQTIGDKLSFIKEKYPGGQLGLTKTGYYYAAELDNTNITTVYFLDKYMECEAIAINPNTQVNVIAYIEILDKGWSRKDDHTWVTVRNDGELLKCSIEYVEDVGSIFYVTLIKNQN